MDEPHVQENLFSVNLPLYFRVYLSLPVPRSYTQFYYRSVYPQLGGEKEKITIGDLPDTAIYGIMAILTFWRCREDRRITLRNYQNQGTFGWLTGEKILTFDNK